MLTRSSLLLLGAAALFLVAFPAAAKTAQKVTPKTVPAEEAIIENSGSTNTQPYHITIYSGGGAEVDGKKLGVPLAMNKQFFHDLAAAMPLTGLTVHHGMRSASFGTRTYITYHGQKSPDLTFGGDQQANALQADITAITQALHMTSTPRRPIAPPEAHPQKQ